MSQEYKNARMGIFFMTNDKKIFSLENCFIFLSDFFKKLLVKI